MTHVQPAEAAFQRTSWRVTWITYALLALAVVAASTALRCSPSPADSGRDRQPKPLSPELTAFLGPIAPGLAIDGWRITATGPVRDGAVRIVLHDDRRRAVQLAVRLRDPADRTPLARTVRLAIAADTTNNADAAAAADTTNNADAAAAADTTNNAATAAARALAAALTQRERIAPVPEDLTMQRHAASSEHAP